MPGIRCYFSPTEDFDGQQILLDATESRHLLKARRARSSDEVTVFDGEGNIWQCRLAGTGHNIARLAVLSHRGAAPPALRYNPGPGPTQRQGNGTNRAESRRIGNMAHSAAGNRPLRSRRQPLAPRIQALPLTQNRHRGLQTVGQSIPSQN